MSCPHPYFSEAGTALSTLLVLPGAALLVIGAPIWIVTRTAALGGMLVAIGMLTLASALVGIFYLDELVMRLSFGSEDWTRLQRELQSREADVDRYAREHPGLTTPQIVKGFLATYERPNGFQFADPDIPPLYFKVSDWRDTVPRVVVGFGCYNNVLFDSSTMSVQSSD